MALIGDSRSRLEFYGEAILKVSEADLLAEINGTKPNGVLDGPLIPASDGVYSTFFAPFDWINDSADIVIVGVTPGRQQATEALLQFRRALAVGKDIDTAAQAAKQAASFKGEMREIGARLMDHFSFHEVFKIGKSEDLFGAAAHRAHYTSVLRYPVLRRGSNYSGHDKILNVPFLRKNIEAFLADELALFPTAWIVPFGPTALLVVEDMARRGILDPARVLGGLNHPSGTQWNRHKCQLDEVDHAQCSRNVGCATIQQRSRVLRSKVKRILGATAI